VGALAEIIRRHGDDYIRQFSPLPPGHRRVLRDLARCRTPEAGGQLWHCPQCGQVHTACHSCGNRHCPTCGGDDARAWLDRQVALHLPVPYFLCTCTVPEPLRSVMAGRPKALLNLLFQAASSALLDLCRNPKWFGATPGLTAVLHTWSRALIYHPHLHFLVTGGGWDATGVWRWPERGFLVPAPALSTVYRARFKAGLERLAPELLAQIPAEVWTVDWVVHIQNVGNGTQALKYLARYIYRVALTDSSILSHDATSVRFRYRDAKTHKPHTLSLPVFAFLHRFLQHVLPKGFVKVRYYGLHHPAHRQRLALARAALYLHFQRPIPPPPEPAPRPPLYCPACRTPLVPGVRFAPGALPPSRGPP
jgi:hypothetical protein